MSTGVPNRCADRRPQPVRDRRPFRLRRSLRHGVPDPRRRPRLVATEAELGKPPGQDLAEGIYTLPVQRALLDPVVGPSFATFSVIRSTRQSASRHGHSSRPRRASRPPTKSPGIREGRGRGGRPARRGTHTQGAGRVRLQRRRRPAGVRDQGPRPELSERGPQASGSADSFVRPECRMAVSSGRRAGNSSTSLMFATSA